MKTQILVLVFISVVTGREKSQKEKSENLGKLKCDCKFDCDPDATKCIPVDCKCKQDKNRRFGPAGPKGCVGRDGLCGRKGSTGLPGKPGLAGQTGRPGLKGKRGYFGKNGQNGLKGARGDHGTNNSEIGANGPRGHPGNPGIPGPAGDIGRKGHRGKPGEFGNPGKPGQRGKAGSPGSPGPIGDILVSRFARDSDTENTPANFAKAIRQIVRQWMNEPKNQEFMKNCNNCCAIKPNQSRNEWAFMIYNKYIASDASSLISSFKDHEKIKNVDIFDSSLLERPTGSQTVKPTKISVNENLENSDESHVTSAKIATVTSISDQENGPATTTTAELVSTTSGSLWLPLGPIDPSISDPDPIYPENSDLETENPPGSTIYSDFPDPIRFSEDILIFDDKNGNENFDKLDENMVSTTASNKDVSEPQQELANFDEFEIFGESETEKIFSTITSSNIKTKQTDQRPQTPLPPVPELEPSDSDLTGVSETFSTIPVTSTTTSTTTSQATTETQTIAILILDSDEHPKNPESEALVPGPAITWPSVLPFNPPDLNGDIEIDSEPSKTTEWPVAIYPDPDDVIGETDAATFSDGLIDRPEGRSNEKIPLEGVIEDNGAYGTAGASKQGEEKIGTSFEIMFLIHE